MIVGKVPYSDNIISMIDITIDSDKVLASDVDRLMHSLKKSYELMMGVKQKAENYETYLNEIEFTMPKNSLLNLSSTYRPDEVSLTDKQRKERFEQHQNLTKKIVEKIKSSHNV